MSLERRAHSFNIDFSKIPSEYHSYADQYVFARESAPVYAASLIYAIAKQREAHRSESIEAIMETDVEYAIANAEHQLNTSILLDDRANFVLSALETDEYINPDPRGYLGEVE